MATDVASSGGMNPSTAMARAGKFSMGQSRKGRENPRRLMRVSKNWYLGGWEGGREGGGREKGRQEGKGE